MSVVQKWVQVTVRIPVDIEADDCGLTYVTSPLLRGLLVAGKDEKSAILDLPSKIEDLGCASAIKPPADAR